LGESFPKNWQIFYENRIEIPTDNLDFFGYDELECCQQLLRQRRMIGNWDVSAKAAIGLLFCFGCFVVGLWHLVATYCEHGLRFTASEDLPQCTASSIKLTFLSMLREIY